MTTCNCEHWQVCPTCKPDMFDDEGNRLTFHGPEGPSWTNAQAMAMRKIMRDQAEWIKELSEDRDTWKARTEFSFQQRDKLAAQNKQLSDILKKVSYVEPAWLVSQIDKALALPDLAGQVLNRVKAEALREAYRLSVSSEGLLDMADAIEKGEG